ncbi:MAG: phosphoglycolate phosphatase [Yoonia sp.]|jgi:phosphoglycolate phosphatase
MIKGIIFDKDGTLFDFNATWGAWARGMLEAETKDAPQMFDVLADVLGYDSYANQFRAGSVVIAATVGEVADCIISILPNLERQALLGRMNAAAAMVPQQEALPLKPYFSQLSSLGLKLGLATNDAEAPARAHLEKAGIMDLFDFVAGYDSGHGGKPAPGQLLAFCAQTSLAPADCIMVGDSTHDLHAGRAAGMGTIGVLTGPAPACELAPFADVILPNIGSIPDWLISQKPTAL